MEGIPTADCFHPISFLDIYFFKTLSLMTHVSFKIFQIKIHFYLIKWLCCFVSSW